MRIGKQLQRLLQAPPQWCEVSCAPDLQATPTGRGFKELHAGCAALSGVGWAGPLWQPIRTGTWAHRQLRLWQPLAGQRMTCEGSRASFISHEGHPGPSCQSTCARHAVLGARSASPLGQARASNWPSGSGSLLARPLSTAQRRHIRMCWPSPWHRGVCWVQSVQIICRWLPWRKALFRL
jgi:hypothetical protein